MAYRSDRPAGSPAGSTKKIEKIQGGVWGVRPAGGEEIQQNRQNKEHSREPVLGYSEDCIDFGDIIVVTAANSCTKLYIVAHSYI